MTTARIKLPPKLVPVFQGEARYRGSYGGRGSGKTRTFAKMAAVHGYRCGAGGLEGQILCAREHLNSLDESSMEEVKLAIRSEPWLNAYYEIGERYIRSQDGRIRFTFAGLRHNVDSIKSKARLLLAWVDEAEAVQDASWIKMIPTVREAGSEIWVTWNPESKTSATHKRFRLAPPDDAKIAELNWRDNPWFPDVLDRERMNDKARRPYLYDHVWEGDFLAYAEGALWSREMIDAALCDSLPTMRRVVVAIDPATTSKEESDETGIIVCGLGADGRGYVLDDDSGRFSPAEWAKRAIALYRKHGADRLVAEGNQGGEMVRHTLQTEWKSAPITIVHASRGKAARAEPVAALYEQGRVRHAQPFPDLEAQMVKWEPLSGMPSPDRLDAMVWGFTDLILGDVYDTSLAWVG